MPKLLLKCKLTYQIAFLSISASALAQTTPDAGALRQQIEQNRDQGLPRKVMPDKPLEPKAMPAQAGVVVTVKSFRFAGNTLISSEALSPVLDSFLNRPLDYAQLQAATVAVANAYRKAGWIVRVYLPQQDVTEGTITLQIVEAVFGGVKFEGAPATRIAPARIQGVFNSHQATGDPLNAEALDRALLIADDLPGVTVAGSLRPGSAERETDLFVKLADEPLVGGDVGFDNTGARSTGNLRASSSFNFYSALGLGDLISANFTHTLGSDYVRLGATAPVGYDGWRLGASASSLNYKILTEFSASKLFGSSTTEGLEASYPLIRSRLKNLYLGLNVDRKHFANQSALGTESHYDVNTVSVALNSNLFDNLGGGGANAASLVLTEGKVDLGNLDRGERPSLNGSFSKLRYSLSRQQVLSDTISLYAALSGQHTDASLDSSEKIYLGGAYGVRAYPSNEGGGSSGYIGNVELRWRLSQGLSVTGFVDDGHIKNYDDTASYSLRGSGLALTWQGSSGLNVKGTWARRTGDNPNPTATGNDQDGTLQKDRLWLTVNMPF
jgi:hemolysin activation/secretion protein